MSLSIWIYSMLLTWLIYLAQEKTQKLVRCGNTLKSVGWSLETCPEERDRGDEKAFGSKTNLWWDVEVWVWQEERKGSACLHKRSVTCHALKGQKKLSGNREEKNLAFSHCLFLQPPSSLPQPLFLQGFAEMEAREGCMAEVAQVISDLAELWVSAPSIPPSWNTGSCNSTATSPESHCAEKCGSHGDSLHMLQKGTLVPFWGDTMACFR